LLLHLANTVLLFLLVRRMTGATGRSAFVAALFALHPLHVESVAWVTERKDVLSGLFWILTIWAYTAYVSRPDLRRYLLVVALYILALLSKPMVVTLPVVLLLLDYWPLRRMGPRASEARRAAALGGGAPSASNKADTSPQQPTRLRLLLAEKVPLFAL